MGRLINRFGTLEHYACFACRKAFKRVDLRVRVLLATNGDGVSERVRLSPWVGLAPTAEPAPTRCPECRRPMFGMGRNFRAPRRSDRKQWAKVRLLAINGIRFSSLGTGPLPRRLADVVPYLKARPARSSGEDLARTFGSR